MAAQAATAVVVVHFSHTQVLQDSLRFKELMLQLVVNIDFVQAAHLVVHMITVMLAAAAAVPMYKKIGQGPL